MATLAEMVTDVRERIGEDTADFFSAAEVTRAINLGVTTFTAEEPWPWLYTEFNVTLEEGQEEYELPANVSVHRVFNISLTGGPLSQGGPLERLSPERGFRARFEWQERPQTPIYYYLVAATRDPDETIYVIRFVPVPDQEYDLEGLYLRVPDDLSADADVADLPTEFHPAIPAWAAGHLFLKELQVSQKASEQFGLYGEVLRQARKTLEVHEDENLAYGRDLPSRYRRRNTLRDRIPLTLGP